MSISRYAVFGNPVAHSQSPFIHRQFALQLNESVSYQKQEVALGEFAAAARDFFAGGGGGLNVTVPFKRDAAVFADELSERAERADAVNTLVLRGEKVVGDNTDGVGLLTDLQQNLRWSLAGKKVLLLGAGGAARGVLSPLLASAPASLCLANRTEARALTLASAFATEAETNSCQLMALPCSAVPSGFDLVVNATSASLSGELPAVNAAAVDGAYCYDMMYAATATPFLRWAAKSGARQLADGLGMLVEQAAESFFLWRGRRPETTEVIAALRRAII